MLIRQAEVQDLDVITELSFQKNQQKEHRIAYCCKQREHIRNDYQFMIESGAHMVLIAEENEKIVGVLGLFCIEEIKRLDCCGPFVESGYEQEAAALVREAKQLRPEYRLSMYFDQSNQQYLHMAESLGAVMNGLELGMLIQKGDVRETIQDSMIEPIEEKDYAKLAALHDHIFPGMYLSGSELIESIGEERQVFVIKQEDEIAAYGVLTAPEDSDVAGAEVFAVAEQYRGMGYGRKVVNEVLRQGFAQYSINAMNLIVDDDNEPAKTLYQSVGFKVQDRNYNMSL